MIWIVENLTNESSYLELADAIKEAGHTLKEIKGDFKYVDISEFNNDIQPVIFLGSIQMSNLVARELVNAYPVVYNSISNYRCTEYYSHFGELLFNDKYAFITLKELHRQKFHFYGSYGKEGLIFVRPDSGQKPFQAQLVDIIDIDRFVENNRDYDHSLVLVSTPKTIRGEWRFVVSRHKEIITYSTYQFQGQVAKVPGAPEGAIKFVKRVLDVGYHPDSVFCVDVAEDADGNFWLLELTSFSSAGLYACNKKKIVEKVSEIATQDYLMETN
jgi:hypothetical protein